MLILTLAKGTHNGVHIPGLRPDRKGHPGVHHIGISEDQGCSKCLLELLSVGYRAVIRKLRGSYQSPIPCRYWNNGRRSDDKASKAINTLLRLRLIKKTEIFY